MVCDANLRGSVGSCGGAVVWQLLGCNRNEWSCSSRLLRMCCPPFELGVWAVLGSTVVVCSIMLLPSTALRSSGTVFYFFIFGAGKVSLLIQLSLDWTHHHLSSFWHLTSCRKLVSIASGPIKPTSSLAAHLKTLLTFALARFQPQ